MTVALLFSGGLDSAAAALLLAEDHEQVHLLTYDNGHGHVGIRLSRGTARDLARSRQGVFVHHIADCGELFRELVTRDLAGNSRPYGSRFIWCLGCKLAMHSHTIAYCLRHGIDGASDGSSRETEYYVEQSPVGLQLIEGLYAEHGVGFVNPVHRVATREEEQRLLASRGVRRGLTNWGRNPGTQPLCIPGNALYLLSTVLDIHPSFPDDEVRRFFADKAPLCRDWIAAHGGVPPGPQRTQDSLAQGAN